MLQDRRVLVVVPARGGSKGVPLKNLQPVAGEPLVARTGRLTGQLPWVDRAVVSTDHAEIAAVARASGLDAPFYRPPELSGDRIGDLEVLEHALTSCESLDGCRYDVIVMLQPTSPLRRVEHVQATVEKLVAEQLDAVWTVSPADLKYHPLKQLALREGRLQHWDAAGADIIARQQLEPLYTRNGAAYAITRQTLLEQGSIMGARCGAVVIDEPMVSIDLAEDFVRVEQLLASRDEPGQPPATTKSGGAGPTATPQRLPRRFVVDIDGVIARLVPDNDYAKAGPMTENIAVVNALHEQGHEIVLFTARGSQTGKDWSETTRRQLAEWGVRYHELHFGKPAADYYIDDRLISLEDARRLTGLPRQGESGHD